jgi:ferrous-iron efflux pump FieF
MNPGTIHAENHILAQRAAIASVTVAAILLVLKTIAVWQTNSVAVLGSLADTSLDLIASIVTLLGVRWAAMPADHDHRFGHGKAEALASLFQVMLIGMAAIALAAESFHRLAQRDHSTGAPETGIAVSIVAIILSAVLVLYQKKAIAQTGSLAIGTDNLHYQSDLYLNLSVIAALVIDHYFRIVGTDQMFGIGIAVWLGWSAWRSASQAVDHLMDKEWSLEERKHFLDLASRHPDIHGIHDMRTRTSGAHKFVQFHASVDPEMTVAQAHVVMDAVEAMLKRDFPDVEILIHADPEGHSESGRDPLRGMEAQDLLDAEIRQGAKPN